MTAEKKVDMITLGLIDNFLFCLVDEMTQEVVRTSFSPLTREIFDFQCGFCRADGEMVMEGQGTLIHSRVFSGLIARWLREHRDITYPGDIIIANDPYLGATHLPDLYLYRPIFVDDELAAWSVVGGHQRDIGGAQPGSCATDSIEIYQEGLRIPTMKLYERGVRNDDLFRVIRLNSRTPDIIEGDIEAFRVGTQTGEKRFREMVELWGWEEVKYYFDELLDYTERLTRAEIKAMPDGEYEFTDYLDDGGKGFLDAQGNITSDLVPIRTKITVKGDELIYDFTGTSPQVKGAMNNPRATVDATVLNTLRFSMGLDIPRNDGAFRPVTVIAPEGCLLNPTPPTAVASRGGTLGRHQDSMLGAQAMIRPDRAMACASQVDTLINFAGYDEAGKRWVIIEGLWGGWGGRPTCDGCDYNTCPVLNAGNISMETSEEGFPISFDQYVYVPDTEGAGKYRGSVAVARDYRILADEVIVQLRVDRQRTKPYGICGGQDGTLLHAIVNPGTENREVYKSTFDLKKNDVIRIQVAGAGGYGDPLERDVDMVLKDVYDEKVSIGRAKETYGVVIDEDTMAVDMNETERLREAMKKQGV